MPLNKNSFTRYRIIDACMRNTMHPFPSKEFLLEKCRERLDRNISASTIEKDLYAMRELSEPGYYAPIRFDRINKGYFYEDPVYSISNIAIRDEDLATIEYAGAILQQFKNIPVLSRFSRSIDNIMEVVSARKILGGDNFFKHIQLEQSENYPGNQWIEPILCAIKDKHPICLRHQSFRAKPEAIYIIHPYLLKEFRNRWYLVGLTDDTDEIRTFGLERILGVEAHIELAFKETDFNADAYFQYTVGIIAPQFEPETIVFEAMHNATQYILTQPIHQSQKVIKETRNKVTFSIRVHPTYEFMALILGYQDEIRIVKPAWLKNRMVELLERMIWNYQR